MRSRLFRSVAFSWLGVLVLSLGSTAAVVDEIRVLCSNGIKSVVEELIPEFERSTNQKVNIMYGVSASLARQIDAGEPFDVAILTAALIDEAVEHQRIQRGSPSALARSAMALGIQHGRSKPAHRFRRRLEKRASRRRVDCLRTRRRQRPVLHANPAQAGTDWRDYAEGSSDQ